MRRAEAMVRLEVIGKEKERTKEDKEAIDMAIKALSYDVSTRTRIAYERGRKDTKEIIEQKARCAPYGTWTKEE